ncbi:unnamed protein product [Clonostachys rosea]|uniref:Uncharacterized protein n=1 Tax=Bionectria ochroleuca TaxID=29856 RepID=A0ABY6UPF9_BIOOC|nr:unnamed protein product [Clonostachys rosea]
MNPSLVPLKYELFPLGTIKPNGWLKDQLRLSALGLGGNLFHFYRFVKESTWLGGTWEYTPLNEAAPYWYNYIVPLAYSLDQSRNPELFEEIKRQADYFLDYTLSHQAEDGWLGPETTPSTRGLWARCLLLQGLLNHAQADSSKCSVIMEAIYRFIRLAHSMLKDNYRGYLPREGDVFDLQLFGVARAHELALTLQSIYEGTSDENDRKVIWEVMDLMWEGSRIGKRDWTKFFGDDFPKTPAQKWGTKRDINFKHGVNVSQGKFYSSTKKGIGSVELDAVTKTFKYHGTPAGSLTSDEFIGGLSSQRASELCCSVELIFSLAYLYQLFGDGEFAERAESAAFNAVPAGISADWWSHQYVTQTNQPWACEFQVQEGEKVPYYDVCKYANVFGLEPEFVGSLSFLIISVLKLIRLTQPCCTVNHPTAMPKLLMNAFLSKNSDEAIPSIIHAYLVPATLKVDGITIECQSNYPFAPCALRYSIATEKAFELLVRVPSWAKSTSEVELRAASGESSSSCEKFAPNTKGQQGLELFHRVYIPKAGSYTIFVTVEAEVQVKKLRDNSIAVYYGPLLYAYEIPFKTQTRLPREYKDQVSDCREIASVADQDDQPWKVHTRDHDYIPSAEWNIGIDTSKPMTPVVERDPWQGDGDERTVTDLPDPLWESGAAPVSIEVTAVKVAWPVRSGTAADVADVDRTSPQGPPFKVRLVPYGTAKLHIAQFPVVEV